MAKQYSLISSSEEVEFVELTGAALARGWACQGGATIAYMGHDQNNQPMFMYGQALVAEMPNAQPFFDEAGGG